MHQTLLFAFIIFLWDVLTSTNPLFRNINPTTLVLKQVPLVMASNQKAVVRDVISGDTVVLSTGETVKYIGIKSPDTGDKEECFGQNAKEANKIYVLGKEVILRSDRKEKDQSGNLLRYVYVDGMFVNKELVSEGFAKVAPTSQNNLHDAELKKAETYSKTKEKGIWHYCISSE